MKNILFVASEGVPFIKTGGLADVVGSLPKCIDKRYFDVRVILPKYTCISQEMKDKMSFVTNFYMDFHWKNEYVGILHAEVDGVKYYFIDNEMFFNGFKPYSDNALFEIEKYAFFSKAALSILPVIDFRPDIIHCHDWQTGLIPVYLKERFQGNEFYRGIKSIMTIHNLKFQGKWSVKEVQDITGLPPYFFTPDKLELYKDANLLKGGLVYADAITTVSQTYAEEIKTSFYGEQLEGLMCARSNDLRGIVNGIDYDIWNSYTDDRLYVNYDITNVLEKKKENKHKLQEELGLVQDDHKFVIGLISRLTDQKGLDLVNSIMTQIMDEHTQIVVLGSGDQRYEDSFRYYEYTYKGNVCSNIMYDETRAHRIYAGADALLVPSQFEPCGLTQLIAMHYGTIPIVRETGGLKDTVEPYNMYSNMGNGFTFDRYDAGLLLDAINRAKSLYFLNRWCWDEMVQRDMDKNLSWDNSAKQYKNLYLDLT